ncbi:MAG: hypothetical protein ABJE95_08845 [Byssovorax sp.]
MNRPGFAFLVALGALASTASADEAPPPLAPVRSVAPLPVEPSPPAVAATHRSPGMMVAGIVITSVGIAALVGGAAGAGVAATSSSDDGQIRGAITGLVLLPASVLFAAVGVPLWVVGARAPKATATPALATSPGATGLRWTF